MAVETRCDTTDLPEWLCSCPEHRHVRPSTEVVTLARAEQLAGRPLPQYAYRPRLAEAHLQKTRRWHAGDAEPGTISCDHPTAGNQQLCTACATDLHLMLRDVPSLAQQLDLARSRQVVFVDHGTIRREGAHPWTEVLNEARPGTQLPKRFSVTAYARPAANALQRLTRALAGVAADLGSPAQLAAAWLDRFDELLLDPQMPRFAHRLSQAVVRGRQVIERPADLEVVGDCPRCGELVFAELLERDASPQQREAQYAECHTCHTPVGVAAAKRAALDAKADRLMTMVELVGAIAGANAEPVTRDQINGWVKSGRLLRREIDVPEYRAARPGEQEVLERPGFVRVVKKVSAYRVSEVRELAREALEKRRRR